MDLEADSSQSLTLQNINTYNNIVIHDLLE